jgi:hypothetical protein
VTRSQRQIVLALTLVVALTRLFAIARSLHDWDEAQFAHGVRDYDVAAHQPHPPGYPVFLGAAKLVHLAGVEDEFRAVQSIVVLSAMLLFPIVFFLARELGLSFGTSVVAALLYVFFPHVWVYGGTGFSDIPGAVLGLLACALLLRGRRDPHMLLAGAAALGVAAGIRPLNLILGVVPALLATWSQIRARAYLPVVAAILVGGTIVTASYAGAALASESVPAFLDRVRTQQQYVAEVDSWRNPTRGSWWQTLRLFGVFPFDWRSGLLPLAVLAMVGTGKLALRERSTLALVLGTFVPLATVSWWTLDIGASARYALPYFVAHAILATVGLEILAGGRQRVHAALALGVVLVCAGWTVPILSQQRNEASPSEAAFRWIREAVPQTTVVYTQFAVTAQARFLLPDHRKVYYEDPGEISPLAPRGVAVDPNPLAAKRVFVWTQGRAQRVLRNRNQVLHVGPFVPRARFETGWYDEEGGFRWMANEGRMTLAPVEGKGRLRFAFLVPLEHLAAPPTIEILSNDTVVDRFVASSALMERTIELASRDRATTLVLRTSAVANLQKKGLSGDGRDLGLRLNELTWTAAN